MWDKQIKLPKHLAIDLEGVAQWAESNNRSIEDSYKRSFGIVQQLVEQQIALKIPILTFFVMSPGLKGIEQGFALLNGLVNFLGFQEFKDVLIKNKVKVTVLGKWYDLPSRVVDAIRKITEETKYYDSFFLNFCINYDGREEIVDACKLIGKQIKMGKVDPEMITKDLIKENLYSSYFIPPDAIIRNGTKAVLTSLLLWDTVGARIYFSKRSFPDLTADSVLRILAMGK